MTSTLQQEGGRKLRLSSSQVMRVAQGLYERGYITYMRTDNVVLSDEAMQATRAAVTSEYGQKFLSPAPEAVHVEGQERPGGARGDPPDHAVPHAADRSSGELNSQELALYRLIWQRTLASQMADATGVTVSVRLGATPSTVRPANRRLRVRRLGHDDHVPRLSRRLRRRASDDGDGDRRAGGAAAGARPRATSCRSSRLTPNGHTTVAAGPLHRGLAGQAARRTRHRSPVDLGVDHPDDPGPRLRVEEGPGARARRGPRSPWSVCSSSTSTSSSTTTSPPRSTTTSTRSPTATAEGPVAASASTSARRRDSPDRADGGEDASG